MFVTTLTASYQLFMIFLKKSSSAKAPGDSFTFILDATLVAAMAILAIITLLDSIFKWYGWLKKKSRQKTQTVPVEFWHDTFGTLMPCRGKTLIGRQFITCLQDTER